MTPVRLPKQMWKVDGDAVNDLYYLKCYFTVFLSSNEEESRAEQSREEQRREEKRREEKRREEKRREEKRREEKRREEKRREESKIVEKCALILHFQNSSF